jgi:DNA-binding response OmpR family regulator
MKKILVVDDNEFICDTLKQTLDREGYDTTTAVDSHDAFSKFRRNNYDLVITDLYMPNMDGIELMSLLTKHNPMVKLICISGGKPAFREADLNLAKQMGAKFTMHKPFDMMEMTNCVWKLLN